MTSVAVERPVDLVAVDLDPDPGDDHVVFGSRPPGPRADAPPSPGSHTSSSSQNATMRARAVATPVLRPPGRPGVCVVRDHPDRADAIVGDLERGVGLAAVEDHDGLDHAVEGLGRDCVDRPPEQHRSVPRADHDGEDRPGRPRPGCRSPRRPARNSPRPRRFPRGLLSGISELGKHSGPGESRRYGPGRRGGGRCVSGSCSPSSRAALSTGRASSHREPGGHQPCRPRRPSAARARPSVAPGARPATRRSHLRPGLVTLDAGAGRGRVDRRSWSPATATRRLLTALAGRASSGSPRCTASTCTERTSCAVRSLELGRVVTAAAVAGAAVLVGSQALGRPAPASEVATAAGLMAVLVGGRSECLRAPGCGGGAGRGRTRGRS